MTTHDNPFGPIIHTYTRKQAIADGYLIDVTDTAREAGFTLPVALTADVWNDCVRWTADDTHRKPEYTGQDERGRLWDVVSMARMAAAVNRGTDRVTFAILRIPAGGRGITPRRVKLAATVGPGDTPEPVITIMHLGQD